LSTQSFEQRSHSGWSVRTFPHAHSSLLPHLPFFSTTHPPLFSTTTLDLTAGAPATTSDGTFVSLSAHPLGTYPVSPKARTVACSRPAKTRPKTNYSSTTVPEGTWYCTPARSQHTHVRKRYTPRKSQSHFVQLWLPPRASTDSAKTPATFAHNAPGDVAHLEHRLQGCRQICDLERSQVQFPCPIPSKIPNPNRFRPIRRRFHSASSWVAR
jgi:hypothetical protein